MRLAAFNVFPLLFFVLPFFSTCNEQKECTNCGSVLWKKRILDKTTGKFISPINERDRKTWFMDSLIIGEGSHVDIIEDEFGKVTYKTYAGEYTFIDLRTKTFYEYQTFSDTARIVDSYRQPDSGRNKRGWNFFSTNTLFPEENLRDIPDTIINNQVYKRIESFKIVEITNPEEQKFLGKGQKILLVGYLRCDSIKSGLSLDKTIEKKTGCSVLRLDQIAPSDKSYLVTEIESVSTKLTAEELRVFKAWERNAKNNPVNQ